MNGAWHAILAHPPPPWSPIFLKAALTLSIVRWQQPRHQRRGLAPAGAQGANGRSGSSSAWAFCLPRARLPITGTATFYSSSLLITPCSQAALSSSLLVNELSNEATFASVSLLLCKMHEPASRRSCLSNLTLTPYPASQPGYGKPVEQAVEAGCQPGSYQCSHQAAPHRSLTRFMTSLGRPRPGCPMQAQPDHVGPVLWCVSVTWPSSILVKAARCAVRMRDPLPVTWSHCIDQNTMENSL